MQREDYETPELQPTRLIVANMAHTVFQGPGGSEIHSGSKLFSPGTKLAIARAFWGECGARVEVVGQARRSRRIINAVMATHYLYNFRVATVGNPAVLRKLTNSFSSYLFDPRDPDRLDVQVKALSAFYWWQAFRGRCSAGLGLEGMMRLFAGEAGERLERQFASFMTQRLEQGESEPAAAEGAARALLPHLTTEPLSAGQDTPLSEAARLSTLWQM